jgi:DNA-binding NarL/FixJ family response regulator
VSKESEPEILEKALRAVGQGEIWASHRLATLIIMKSLPGKEEEEELTQREWEILALVSSGHQNKEIASRLSISSNTIKAHLSAIYKKLQVRTRLGAALHYFQQAKQRPSAELDETVAAPGRPSGQLRRRQTP